MNDHIILAFFLLVCVAATNTSHKPFYWTHVPKTGSSFATTIGKLCCGNFSIDHEKPSHEDWPWWMKKNFSQWPCMHSCAEDSFAFGSHTPLRLGEHASGDPGVTEEIYEKSFFSRYSVITMLRRPRSRLESGFFHNFHSCDTLQQEAHQGMHALNITSPIFRDKVVAFMRNIINNSTALATRLKRYVDCVKGCSVKMIIGLYCGDNVSSLVLKDGMDTALRRIEQFKFVGFQEHWADSIKIFHSKFGGSFSEESLYNSRKGRTEFTDEEIRRVTSLLEQPEYQDEYDEALYQHAFKFHWNKTNSKSLR